jgi:opacity protein-like surface antigen
MRRFATAAAALILLGASAAARAGEGVFVTIDAGYGLWGKDAFITRLKQNNLGTDPTTKYDNWDLLANRQMPDGGVLSLHFGYNIAGHVAFEGSVTGRPYDFLQDTFGGALLLGVATRWYPLQGLIRPNRQFDISLLAGVDYVLSGGNGIHGPTPSNAATGKLANTGRGFDGNALEFGFTAELYPAPWISFGITPRLYVIDPIRYFIDYNNADKGGAIPLTGSGTVTLYSVCLSITFHVAPQD